MVKIDDGGNFVIIDVTIDGKRLTLVNIYGPNKDSPVFFDNLFINITSFEDKCVLICGDFSYISRSRYNELFTYKHPKSWGKVEKTNGNK